MSEQGEQKCVTFVANYLFSALTANIKAITSAILYSGHVVHVIFVAELKYNLHLEKRQ